MNENDEGGIGPARIIGALIAVGLFGGRRGQLVLRRLKRLAGVGSITFLAGSSATPLLPGDFAGPWLTLCLACALAGFLFWCYVVAAIWLTRDGDGP